MATPRQIRTLQTAQPFRKFQVRMASGRTFTIAHPENVACDLKGREMAVFDEDDFHMLDMNLVEVVEVAESEIPTEGNGV